MCVLLRNVTMCAGYRNPLDQGISYEDMYMTTLDGVTIHGWLLKSPSFDEVRGYVCTPQEIVRFVLGSSLV